MKKILFLIIVLYTTNICFSQNQYDFKKIQWIDFGDKKYSNVELIGANDKDLFLFYLSPKRYNLIEKYNLNNLKQKKTNNVELRFKNKTTPFYSAMFFGDTPVILTTFFNKKTRYNYLFFSKINEKSLTIEKPVLLHSYKQDKKFLGVYQSYFSFDNSKIDVSENQMYYSFLFENIKSNKKTKRQNKNFIVKIMDSGFNIVTEQKITFPFNEFSIEEIKTSNEGKVFILIRTTKRIKNKEGESVNYEYYIYSVDKNKNIESEKIVLESGNKIFSPLLQVDDGEVSAIGFYGNSNSIIKGVSNVFFDDTLGVGYASFNEFSEDFILKLNSNKSNYFDPFDNFVSSKILIDSEGNKVFLAEQYKLKIVENTSTNSKGESYTSTSYIYVYGNIIVFKFNTEGDLIYNDVVKKGQRTVNDEGEFGSFFTTKDDESFSVLYPNEYKLYRTTFNNDGTTKKEVLLDLSGEKLKISNKSKQYENGYIVLKTMKAKALKRPLKIGVVKG
jgi:hypothetical protein